MPLWKYAGNRGLSFLKNATFKTSLSEFHSGLRVYNAHIFNTMPFKKFSNDFVFDSEVIAWLIVTAPGKDWWGLSAGSFTSASKNQRTPLYLSGRGTG